MAYRKKRRYNYQLKMGIKTELEHKKFLQRILKTKNPKRIKWGAKQIAKDHIAEKRNYYTLMRKYKL